MGVDDPSQNFTEMPDLHGVAANAAPSDIKDMQIEKSPTENESVKYNDIEMKVADKPVVPNSRTVMASATTPGEIKRKIDDNVLCSNIQISFKKQAKLEQEEQADPKPLPQNGESNSPTNCPKAGGATHATNGPITVATKPVHISAVDLTSAEQNSENTNDVPLSLSNGDAVAAVPLDDTQEVIITADLQNSRPVPVPPKEPISVRSEAHPQALLDHSVYCRLGTWVKTEETEEIGDEDLQEQEEEGQQLLEMVHEFLESFYVKYGSFIPLAENDVVDHLKQKGKSDLTDKAVDIEKQVTRYRAGLASAPVAGFAVAHNRHTLSLEDLSTLEEQNWINDQIINMYGELIMEATEQKVHFFNSFFHKQLVAKGYEGVKRWTKKIDLFSKWLVLIPIHLEIHWSLVTVSMAHKTISYYDSQGIVFRHTTENIMKYLLAEAKEKKQTAFQKGWKLTIVKGIPQQKNDSDCGVFVLEVVRAVSNLTHVPDFGQNRWPLVSLRLGQSTQKNGFVSGYGSHLRV
uniref:Ubiquitin-like protease family profile domain-containing protein n=1 Tax=Knipowitschia caucasica TaxID=637954 RepID=A0AAV2L0V2_KNICA